MIAIDFGRAIYATGGDPLEYPSAIPSGPVLVMGDSYQEVVASPDHRTFRTKDGSDVDEALRRRGSTPTSGRIVQIAFGAHRNIDNIAWKLADYARSAEAGFPRDFMILPGYLPDADVVACNISSGGHMYSGLLTTREELPIRRYLIGAKCPVSLLLLDRRQMEAMHEMAGIPKPGAGYGSFRCDLAVVTAHLNDEYVCSAQTYAVALPFLSLDGKPMAFRAVATRNRSGYPALSQREMFREVNRVIGAEPEREGTTPIIDSVTRTRRALIAEGPDAVKRIAQDPLFAMVKQKLATEYVLRDEDGKARQGIEDVHPALSGDALWALDPHYRPSPVARHG